MTSPPAADPAALVRLLAEGSLTVATAESLTAGLVSARLADVPGASAVLRGGVVAYATDAKASVLGVDAALLAAGGPVQAQVAAAMAAGVARLLGASVGVATTGVAGPGPQDGVPAGTVHVAVVGVGAAVSAGEGGAHPEGACLEELLLTGDRAAVREAAVRAVLDLLGRWLRERAEPAAR